MKRFLLSYALLLTTLLSVAQFTQFTATGTHKIYTEINGVKIKGIDYLIVFDGISTQSAIIYTGSYNNIHWYTFENQTTPIILQTPNENYNIEDGSGYVVDIDGVKKYIWVIDYSKHLPTPTSLVAEVKPKEQCDELILSLNEAILPFQYKTSQDVSHTIPRTFQLKYASKEWSETTKAWSDKEMNMEFSQAATKITVSNPPLCDTKFTLTGDNFATDLGLTSFKLETTEYKAVKVACHIVSTASTRAELNEADRPEKADITTASAPLEVVFASNANVPVAEFYEWQIVKDNSLLFTRNDQDLRFTFTEAGTYRVKLTVSNSDNCMDSTSVNIKIVESKIEVPRVFTPNGDGINEEFRVAYKSIVEFRCWVYNRWQQKIYFWTDPQKGWDGKINGRPASEGAYFYVIEAVGSDGEKYNLKGNINLLRGKKD